MQNGRSEFERSSPAPVETAEPILQTVESRQAARLRAVTFFTGGLFVLAILAAFFAAGAIVLPLVLAVFLKLLLQPAVSLLERLFVPRGLAAILPIVLVVGILVRLVAALPGCSSTERSQALADIRHFPFLHWRWLGSGRARRRFGRRGRLCRRRRGQTLLAQPSGLRLARQSLRFHQRARRGRCPFVPVLVDLSRGHHALFQKRLEGHPACPPLFRTAGRETIDISTLCRRAASGPLLRAAAARSHRPERDPPSVGFSAATDGEGAFSMLASKITL
ncbi:AI-2E family transporter [Mesorhizobium sp. LCM 4577]|uniref:AI-2E family transporter n=1 Tax=Mesorhizobium sp. LCM 4577 TaxID=1848288 RepID=UPI000AFCC0CC|nr:hypothetical protein [Mesorhizobium sp. LCM 4577]